MLLSNEPTQLFSAPTTRRSFAEGWGLEFLSGIIAGLLAIPLALFGFFSFARNVVRGYRS